MYGSDLQAPTEPVSKTGLTCSSELSPLGLYEPEPSADSVMSELSENEGGIRVESDDTVWCVCVCVRERESVHVCVCVCERERVCVCECV